MKEISSATNVYLRIRLVNIFGSIQFEYFNVEKLSNNALIITIDTPVVALTFK